MKSTEEKKLRTEKHAMRLSFAGSAAFVVAEFVSFFMTGSHTILMDCLFDGVDLVLIGPFLLLIPFLYKPETERHPYGYGQVESLFIVIKYGVLLTVCVTTIILNIPLFIFAWRYFGLNFLISSLVGMAVSSVFVDLFAMFNIVLTHDPMLASIIGGAIKGFGLGVIYYVGTTTGGVDIVAKLLRMKYPHINLGTLLMLLDAAIIGAYAIIFHIYESAMIYFDSGATTLEKPASVRWAMARAVNTNVLTKSCTINLNILAEYKYFTCIYINHIKYSLDSCSLSCTVLSYKSTH